MVRPCERPVYPRIPTSKAHVLGLPAHVLGRPGRSTAQTHATCVPRPKFMSNRLHQQSNVHLSPGDSGRFSSEQRQHDGNPLQQKQDQNDQRMELT